MRTSKSPYFLLAFQEATKAEPFYRLPVDWPDAIRTKSDKESNGTVWWRKTLYKNILKKRSPTALSHAISWLEQVLPSKPDALLGTTKFRKLLNLTFDRNYQIDGFPDAEDIELYALLAVLLINERKLALRVAESSQTMDRSWLAENEAQIREVYVVCWKLREAYVAGEKDGLVANNKKGGKSRNKKIDPYRIPIIDRYEAGEKEGEWKDLGDAYDKIYEELKAKKESLKPIPSRLTVERWIRDHRQGIGFDLEDLGDLSLSVTYL